MNADMNVTLRPKCYIYVCVGCDLLSQTERTDTITCSPACRVRAHRNGSAKVLRDCAERNEVSAAGVCRAEAIKRLRPDLADRIQEVELEVDDPYVQREMAGAFWQALTDQIEGAA